MVLGVDIDPNGNKLLENRSQAFQATGADRRRKEMEGGDTFEPR